MGSFVGYRCSVCGKSYQPEEVTYTCPDDNGILDVILDYEALKGKKPEDLILEKEPSLWRYFSLLPVSNLIGEATTLRSAGWTPTFSPPQLKTKLGVKQLWVKDESGNPTASFKDRASAILVARAREIGAEVIVTASTGNAGAALAGMSAAVGQESVIFAPKTAPPAKIAQLLIYGARVILVDDNYDAAYQLSLEATAEYGWYNRNTGYNPFTAEGKKTAAYEIWEQVLLSADLDRPLAVFVSVGDGNIISGIHKGFKDLYEIGQIKEMPRIYGVQSTGSAAIYNAFVSGKEEILPVSATTLADSISVNLPSDGLRALRAATQTGGAYVAVEDEQILAAISDLGAVGIFAEPAGATAYAGLKKALDDGLVTVQDPILVLNTGSGLKDVKAARQAAGEAPVIPPNLESVKELLDS
ncbi:MAG TPA: threonine synthase [Chloroflexi bacterium]|nr:MAG: threonine synthase [Chloroflexota bacterium]HDD55315.1 threonine synthase [Chloroflexota bacterium]